MTATASSKMQQEMVRSLNVKLPIVISAHVDRANIKHLTKIRPSHSGKGRGIEQSFSNIFLPYIEELKRKAKKIPQNHSVLWFEMVWLWE